MADNRSDAGSIIRPIPKSSNSSNFKPKHVTSKNQLIEWVNNLLDLGLTRLEEFSSGAIYCQILDAYFEDVIPMNKINFIAKEEYEFITNYKYFQSAFDFLGINRDVNIQKLMKGSPSDGLDTLQYLHKILKRRKPLPMYNARERRHSSLKGGTDTIPLPSWMSGSFNVYGKFESKSDYNGLYLSDPSSPLSDDRKAPTPPLRHPFIGNKQYPHHRRTSGRGSIVFDDTASISSMEGQNSHEMKKRLYKKERTKTEPLFKNQNEIEVKTQMTPRRTTRIAQDEISVSAEATSGNTNPPVSYSVDIRAVNSGNLDVDQDHNAFSKSGTSEKLKLTEVMDKSYETLSDATNTMKGALPNFEKLINEFGKENDNYPYRGKVRSMRDVLGTLIRHSNLLMDDLKEMNNFSKKDGSLNTKKHKRLTKDFDKLKNSYEKSTTKLCNLEKSHIVPQSIKHAITDQQKYLSNTKDLDTSLKGIGAVQATLAQAFLQKSSENNQNILESESNNENQKMEKNQRTQAETSEIPKLKNLHQSHLRSIKIGDYQIRHLKNGDIYKGRYENSKKNGEGVYMFVNGDVYDGNFENDRMGGHGVYTFSNEGRYEGSWRNAMYEGAGMETFARGSTYQGEYADGVRNGWGVCRYYNGDYYEGQWKNGLREGRGMQQCTDDSNYVGDYVEGKRHGFGVYSFPNGDRYLGEYKFDIPHGWGVYLFSAGQRYEGQWQSGKKNGWCIYTIDTGEKWAGEWVDGRPKWVQGLSEGENMEKWPHEIVEKVEYAWTACKKAKEASKEGSDRADEHWFTEGDIQRSIREAVSKATEAALNAQNAKKKAIEIAMKLDELAGSNNKHIGLA